MSAAIADPTLSLALKFVYPTEQSLAEYATPHLELQ